MQLMNRNMTITFFSNFLLHHQTPFCEAMVRHIGEGFRFVATEPVPAERLQMGYKNFEDEPYAVNAHKDDASYQEALRLGRESDVVILGAAPYTFIEERLQKNKLTFRYSERLFKKFYWHFHPLELLERYQKDTRYRGKNFYMLCASAYTAPDCRYVFAYPHKTYKWGYFPPITTESYESLSALKSADKIRIIWVSRFIPLKHPEEIVALAKQLKNDNFSFEIEMLGIGELREEYENIVRNEGLDDVIRFTGPFSPEEVLEHMKRSDVFLFTSDKNEGWGAVMNEAMSCACAPVACREIGSVPYLIKHGENGLVYDKRGKNSLYHNVKILLENNNNIRQTIQKNACQTMAEVWNADTAAERLLTLIDCLQEGRETPYTYGPCSRD